MSSIYLLNFRSTPKTVGLPSSYSENNFKVRLTQNFLFLDEQMKRFFVAKSVLEVPFTLFLVKWAANLLIKKTKQLFQ